MKPHYVYFVREPPEGRRRIHVKVGMSTDPEARLKELMTGHPLNLILDRAIKVKSYKLAKALEYYFHGIFRPYHTSNEWFRLGSFIQNIMDNHLGHYGELIIYYKGQNNEYRKSNGKGQEKRSKHKRSVRRYANGRVRRY